MSDQTRQQLQQALNAIKNGQKDQARAMLTPLIQADPNNADVWWVMAMAVNSPNEMRSALQRVVQIKPDYPNAQAMLDKVNVQLSTSAATAPTPAATLPSTPSGSQIGESLDDLFSPPTPTASAVPPKPAAPSSPSGGDLDDLFGAPPTSSVPRGPGTSGGFTPPPYTPPPPGQAKKGRSPLLYILIGLSLAVVCLCGGCLLLGGGSLLAVFNNPTVQAGLSTVFNLVQAPDKLPSSANAKGTITANQQKSSKLNLLEQDVWKYQGNSGEQITINVTGRGSTSSANFIPFVGLYDSSGALLQRTTLQKSNAQVQSLSYTLPSDATYSILVGGIGGQTGSYDIQVQSSSQ